MFKKIFTLLFVALIAALLSSEISQAQTTYKKDVYPLFSISPLIGVQFPVGGLNDRYKTSYNAGLEASLKINRETAFFLKGGYYNMPVSSDLFGAGSASYIEITAGPRYVFTSPKLKAQLFIEAGIGAYILVQNSYQLTPTYEVPSSSKAFVGVNVGPGVILPLGKVADLVIKTKLHYTFETDARTFIAAVMGVDFKL